MIKSEWRKANWIAKQLDENVDDVYDALLGNITAPFDFCSSVETLSREYNTEVVNKGG